MKKILLNGLLFLSFTGVAFSQTACYTFDETTVPTNNKDHAFNIYGNGNSGFLQEWKVVSGTPSVLTNGALSGVNAYQGSQYTLFAICDASANSSESASVDYAFTQGQTYTVSMAIRNAPLPPNSPTPIDIEYVLLQSPISYTYNTATGCSNTPAIPGNAVVAHSISSFSQNSWQTVSFNVSNLSSNYSQLWIRAKFTSSATLTTTFLCVDSICIKPAATATCYTFDEAVVPTGDKDHAFNIYGNGNSGFLEDWKVLSGTPSVLTSGSLNGFNAFEGNQYALFAVCGVNSSSSESASLAYNFNPGQTYTVSMAIRNTPLPPNPSTPIDIEYVLLQNNIAYTYNAGTGCSATPAIPTGTVTAHTVSGYSQDSWQVISFTISNLTSSYPYLWIRPKFSSGAPVVTSFLCVDSLCISSDLSTGIFNDLNSSNVAVSVMPNPFSDRSVIQVSGYAGIKQVEVVDINGKVIKNIKSSGSSTLEISSEGMVPGLYFYRVTTTDNKRGFGKLIAQ